MSRIVMGDETTVGDGSVGDSVTFALNSRLSTLQFDAVFKDGMALVERTASYLDGPGRNEAKGLPPSITVLYATESMRLTARLLDIASWLLIRRALKDGEITETEARAKRQRLKLQPLGRPSHTKGFEELPQTLQTLVILSFEMLERITQLDQTAASSERESYPQRRLSSATSPNPVGAQVIQLASAFRRRSTD